MSLFSRNIFRIAVLIVTIAISSTADARNLKVRPDGSVRFDAAMEGPTRISIVGDRIAKIIQTDSQFEMSNDGDTGDVFLRFIGSNADKEAGYIITESGHTVSFMLTPRSGVSNKTVLIELIGLPKEVEEEAFGSDGDSFEVDNTSGGSGHANDLVAFARTAFNEKIGLRSAGSVKSKGVVSTYRKGGLKASIRSASVASGLPGPQQFFTSRTLAVFVDDVPAGGRVWVIVVEGK